MSGRTNSHETAAELFEDPRISRSSSANPWSWCRLFRFLKLEKRTEGEYIAIPQTAPRTVFGCVAHKGLTGPLSRANMAY